ncbi:uracil-DNA glycosylase [Candidatus Woesearchaeota archaeon]|nr:MAG: uracil-DNA glycosylase [Candidatus Woesearchaeota archaeon]
MDEQKDKQKELEKVAEEIRESDLPLKESATNLVFGKGNPDAEIMFIGEAPGEKEDLQGVPFVGAAGRELDKLLHLLGLTLADVYIANILKYRPPNNRDPLPDEIRAHTPYLVKQIRIIKPKVIATLGNFATKFVLAKFDVESMKRIGGISFLHGKPVHIEADGLDFTVIPMYHPAAMLYKPPLRKVIEEDFLKMGEFLGLETRKGEARKDKPLTEFFQP